MQRRDVISIRAMRLGCGLLGVLWLVGCSGSASGPATKATPSSNSSSSAERTWEGDADPQGLCKLCTNQEIKDLLGAPVNPCLPISNSATDQAHWDGTNVFAQVRLIKDVKEWHHFKDGKNYEALTGIGKDAFVVSDVNGWNARALTDKEIMVIDIGGPQADRDRAVKLLKMVVERRK